MLNAVGYDCDVLCPDYYHIMGAPEWEDADFQVGPSDQNRPCWADMDLGGYSRPPWFVQGPLSLCIAYLRARRCGEKATANRLWRVLGRHNGTLSEEGGGIQRFGRALHSLVLPYRNYSRLSLSRKIALRMAGGHPLLDWLFHPAALVAGAALWWAAGLICRHMDDGAPERDASLAALEPLKLKYPGMVWEDTEAYIGRQQLGLRRLFDDYDIVHGYGTSAILPFLIGKHPFVAYEHGTIREIPFEPTVTGRLTFEAYGNADVVMLTNGDALYSLPKIRDMDRPYVCALHGFDERTVERRLAVALARPGRQKRFGIDPGRPLFFTPARHDWAIKGNDIALRALARICGEGPAPIMVLVRWGQEIERSQHLIAELGIGENIRWIEPLGKFDLLAAYHDVDAVLDQFVLSCFGAVSIEVMSVGRAALITSVDQELMERFFGAPVPLFAARTIDEVAAAMAAIILDRPRARATAEAAHGWMASHHSHHQVLTHLGEAYQAALPLS